MVRQVQRPGLPRVVRRPPRRVESDDVMAARHGDPTTSHAAMAAYPKEKMAAAADVAIRLFRERGPMADFEFQPVFETTWGEGCDDSLHRQARRTGLDRGKIRDSKVQKVNPRTKRKQVVWEYVDGLPPVIRVCPTCGHILGKDDRLISEPAATPLLEEETTL